MPLALSTLAAAPDAVETVTVRADARAEEPGATTVSSAQARSVPGTEGDAAKVVQMLPGVARPAFGGSGQLVVWGAAPQDTRVYVDGVEVPSLYHLGGLRSILPTDLVRDVTLVPGAYGAEYGRALGGLASVQTRALPTEGTHGFVSADTLDAGAMVSTALSDRVRVAVAARYGWIDRIASAFDGGRVDSYVPVPSYGDWQAISQVALRPRESIKLVFMGSGDALTTTIPSPDPAGTRAQTLTQSFQRLYAVYARTLDDGSTVRVTPFVGHDASRQDDDFGAQPDHLDQDAFVYGVRASNRMPAASWATVTLGVDALGRGTRLDRAGSLTTPPREGDIVAFGQAPGSGYAVDSWFVHELDVGPYAMAELRVGDLVLTPGVRLDALLVEGSRSTPRVAQVPVVGFERLDASLDPRLEARWSPGPRVTFSAAAGTYHQAPAPADLSAVFGSPSLTSSSATHATLGETLHATGSLEVSVAGFYEAMSSLAVRSPSPTPLLAQALVQDGLGRSYGVQVTVRQQLWHGLFGWLSWTVSRSERQNQGDASWRLFDYDQTHVATAVASQTLGSWTFGLRLRAATGLPRTPVVGAFFDSKDDVSQPLFGPQNSTRLPTYWQLDARLEKAFTLPAAARLRVYLEVLNVTNRANAEEIVYDSRWSQPSYVTGLPTIAVLGARVEL